MVKNRTKTTLIIILSLVLILAAAFTFYVSDYYRADAQALAVLQDHPNLLVQNNLTILTPETPSDSALIFYPGAKVEHLAYLPILDKISQSCGVTCILVKMPFNMAIFHANAADEIFAQFPDIENWYISGHSMGGAMASNYAATNPEKVKGLILMGAYIYGNYPDENALTVYGTFNTSVAEKINYTENIVVIEGGNHAQFGNYGKQRGDPDATISREAQQNITVEAVKMFLEKREA